MGTSPIGFDYASFGTASGRRCVKQGIAGESLEALRCIGKPFIFQGFGCADSVRVMGFDFHNFAWASIARATYPFG